MTGPRKQRLKTPQVPCLDIADDDFRKATTAFYGFDKRATADRLRAWLEAHPEAPARQRDWIRSVVNGDANGHMDRVSLGVLRWEEANKEALAQLEMLETWASAARVRILELEMDASHFRGTTRESFRLGVSRIEEAISQWKTLRETLDKISPHTSEVPGMRRVRWEAALLELGFKAEEILAFCQPNETTPVLTKELRESTVGALKRRVKRFLETPFGSQFIEDIREAYPA